MQAASVMTSVSYGHTLAGHSHDTDLTLLLGSIKELEDNIRCILASPQVG